MDEHVSAAILGACRPCRFRCPHCSTRHKILVSAAAIVHEQIVGAARRGLESRLPPLCLAARAETLQYRLLLSIAHHVRSYGEETYPVRPLIQNVENIRKERLGPTQGRALRLSTLS